jgi:hypothetical protein
MFAMNSVLITFDKSFFPEVKGRQEQKHQVVVIDLDKGTIKNENWSFIFYNQQLVEVNVDGSTFMDASKVQDSGIEVVRLFCPKANGFKQRLDISPSKAKPFVAHGGIFQNKQPYCYDASAWQPLCVGKIQV